MKPRIKLAESRINTGGVMAFYEHDGMYSINYDGHELMHSKAHASEMLMGEIGVSGLGPRPRILIGGLGLGFTLKAVLDGVDQAAVVETVEILPEIVDWNRQFLSAINGSCLKDRRSVVLIDDVRRVILEADRESYDLILLDVDNGPRAMVVDTNASLYSIAGLKAIRAALKSGGRIVFWSAGVDAAFQARLKKCAFKVTAVPAKVHPGARRAAYMLYVADKAG